MKKNALLLSLSLLLAMSSCSFTTKKFDTDSKKDKVLIELITYVLNEYHFNKADIDNRFSKNVFDKYIKEIDPLHRNFYKTDIKEFKDYRKQIDDQIKDKSLEFFDLTYERLQQRIDESESIYKEILNDGFNFQTEESINNDYESLDYPDSKKEMKERWRKQLKLNTLSSYYDLLRGQQEDEELKEEDKVSQDSLKRKAISMTRDALENFYENQEDMLRKDWFSMYLNAITSQVDPHTTYFAPRDKDRFDISMSGKLEGIGARLQKEMDHIKIVELISGGPAWKHGKLEIGDEIQRVKQEDEKESVSIVGMRLEDAVELIKGPKGTKVTLTVKKVDGTRKDYTIVRDEVEIQDTYARSAFIDKEGEDYGLIKLPKFYFDMDDYENRNAASDIKKEIKRFKKQNAKGLIIDLRNNGGGSLRTVVDIAGLFIEEGPIVQVKRSNGEKDILRDENDDIVWDKPLVILVNKLSASASEILAAAMQDYKRAIIIGSEQTYGKGTVQNIINLDRWMRNNSMGEMGALKITTQKFYRINGGSTQLKGVNSDVVVPSRYSYIEIGERDYKNPLPWDQIDEADYKPWKGYKNIEKVVSLSNTRIKSKKQITLIDEHAKWIETQSKENTYPLDFMSYRKLNEARQSKSEKFEAIDDYASSFSFESLPYEKKMIETDSVLADKRKKWHKALQKDVYVEESVHVLDDLLRYTKDDKLAKAK
ncbi:MAG: carboxy terminal-processing peptidase [Psychroflexus sp.]|jgi:carboxyl-terminal processing protease|nr:carboxy terminal-processing peptidase [Psychroflexus sp.]